MSDTVPSMERVSDERLRELIAKHQRRGVPLPESGQLFFTKTVDADTLLALTHYAALRAALDVAALSAGVAALVIAAGDGDGGYDSARCREYAAKLRHLIQIQEGA